MLAISKVLTLLLLPPGCIILGMLAVTLIFSRRSRLFLGMLALLFYFLSIQPGADFLLRPLEDKYPPLNAEAGPEALQEAGPLAMVVLGGGTVLGSPEAGAGRDSLSPDAAQRAVYAFSLRDLFSGPYVLSGGKVFDYGQETEAETAARLFTSLGLPPERLQLETGSRNTWENARETAKLGYRRVILVSSAYHLPRSVFCFERNGIEVIPAPAGYKIDRGRDYDYLSFLPSMGALYNSFLALHEYTGLLYYRLRYR